MQAIKSSYGKCRCCLAKGNHKYTCSGVNNEIFKECCNLTLATDTRLTQLMCNACITFLRDVQKFRNMVMASERQLLKVINKEIVFVDVPEEGGSCNDSDVKEEATSVKMEEECDDHLDSSFCAESILSDSIAELKTTKKVSARKRIRLTCDTVLKHTTACPFRHHKSWFQCFFCRKDFMELDMLKQHMIENCSNEDVNIDGYPRTLQIEITDLQCKICQTDLADVTSMVQHFSDVHNKVIYKEFIADYKLNKSPYTCHLCDKQYHVFRTLTVHLNEHYANFMCDVCGKSFLNWVRLTKHKRIHDKGAFPCDKCGKVLKTKSAKFNHMEAHLKRTIKCHICSVTLKHYNDRVKHMSEEHNITHEFRCLKCPRVFTIKHYLATHMRQTHGFKNKKCAECDMMFRTAHGLKRHMSKHFGAKAFVCSFCSKSFARSHTLKDHMRSHESGGKFVVQ